MIVYYGDSGEPDTSFFETSDMAETPKDALVEFAKEFNITYTGTDDNITEGELRKLIEHDCFIIGEII